MLDVDINGRRGRKASSSRIDIFPIGNQDSSLLHWDCSVPVGANPIRKLEGYLEARQLAGDMDTLLGRAAAYLGKKENIYGIPIGEGSTIDTLLVATEPPISAVIRPMKTCMG